MQASTNSILFAQWSLLGCR